MDDRIEFEDMAETTVGAVCESIETNLWLARGYERRGLAGLAADCLRSAWHEYVRFSDVLRVYTGSDALRDRLVADMVRHGAPALAGLDGFPELEMAEACAA